MNRKVYTRCLAVVAASALSLSLLLSSCRSSGVTQQETFTFPEEGKVAITSYPKVEDIPELSGSYKVAETDAVALYVDGTTTDVAVLDKRSGSLYFSNPQKAAPDVKMNEDYLQRMSSLVLLDYAATVGGEGSFYSSRDSVANKNFNFYALENGIRIYYQIGSSTDRELVPAVLGTEQYERIRAAVEESMREMFDQMYRLIPAGEVPPKEEEKLRATYQYIGEEDFYIARSLSANQKRVIKQAAEAAGFTYEDMQEELERAGYIKPITDVSFNIPLDLTLDEDALRISIDVSQVEEWDGIRLKQITLMPGFTATASDNGFALLPDGSGSIMELSGSNASATQVITIYGEDQTCYADTKTTTNAQAVMPVFGLSTEKGGIFSIIEEGAGIASIYAATKGDKTPMSSVYAAFEVTKSYVKSYQGYMNTPTKSVFPPTHTSGKITLRCSFMAGDTPTYSDMAAYYRQYLLDNGVLGEKLTGEVPLYLSMLGGFYEKTTVFGIPVNRMKVLTSYEQAKDILSWLKDQGVSAINVQYSGFSNDGLSNSVYDSIRLEKTLGGKDGYASLMEYAAANNCQVFPNLNLAYVYKNKMGTDFDSKKDASRRIEMTTATLSDYDPATLKFTNDNQRWIVSPTKMLELSDSVAKSLKSLPNTGSVSIGELGEYLNGNYNKTQLLDRIMAEDVYKDVFSQLQAQDLSVMTNVGNAYSWQYTDHILNMPAGSSDYEIAQTAVPFVQMVLHGYISYATYPYNGKSNSNMEHQILKILETGSALHFRFIAADDTELTDTDYSAYFSSNFDQWKDTAMELYREVSPILSSVQGQCLTNHTKLADNVFLSEYENGVKIIVNYGQTAVDLPDMQVTVDAGGYRVLQ